MKTNKLEILQLLKAWFVVTGNNIQHETLYKLIDHNTSELEKSDNKDQKIKDMNAEYFISTLPFTLNGLNIPLGWSFDNLDTGIRCLEEGVSSDVLSLVSSIKDQDLTIAVGQMQMGKTGIVADAAAFLSFSEGFFVIVALCQNSNSVRDQNSNDFYMRGMNGKCFHTGNIGALTKEVTRARRKGEKILWIIDEADNAVQERQFQHKIFSLVDFQVGDRVIGMSATPFIQEAASKFGCEGIGLQPKFHWLPIPLGYKGIRDYDEMGLIHDNKILTTPSGFKSVLEESEEVRGIFKIGQEGDKLEAYKRAAEEAGCVWIQVDSNPDSFYLRAMREHLLDNGRAVVFVKNYLGRGDRLGDYIDKALLTHYGDTNVHSTNRDATQCQFIGRMCGYKNLATDIKIYMDTACKESYLSWLEGKSIPSSANNSRSVPRTRNIVDALDITQDYLDSNAESMSIFDVLRTDARFDRIEFHRVSVRRVSRNEVTPFASLVRAALQPNGSFYCTIDNKDSPGLITYDVVLLDGPNPNSTPKEMEDWRWLVDNRYEGKCLAFLPNNRLAYQCSVNSKVIYGANLD